MNTWPELLITLGLVWKTCPEESVRLEEGDLAIPDEEEVGVSSKKIQLSLLVPRFPRPGPHSLLCCHDDDFLGYCVDDLANDDSAY